MPKSPNNPVAQKQFLDSVCPNSAEISKLRKVRQGWKLFIKSKSSAEKIVEHSKVFKLYFETSKDLAISVQISYEKLPAD